MEPTAGRGRRAAGLGHAARPISPFAGGSARTSAPGDAALCSFVAALGLRDALLRRRVWPEGACADMAQ